MQKPDKYFTDMVQVQISKVLHKLLHLSVFISVPRHSATLRPHLCSFITNNVINNIIKYDYPSYSHYLCLIIKRISSACNITIRLNVPHVP